jgi:hypothetical protein
VLSRRYYRFSCRRPQLEFTTWIARS